MGSQEKDMSALSTEDQLAKNVVREMVEKGIKLLALDFDRTIVSVHTAGYWKQGTHKLVEHVRPCFKALLKAALESSLHVCVVTYSTQISLIRDVLKIALAKSNICKLIIRGNSKDWLPSSNISDPPLGKEQHLACICTELFNDKHVIIATHEILLMDDDNENCVIAREFGHQAFEVPENISMSDIAEYVKTLEVKKILPCPS